jgi:ring-1,2-phenylacetyl-CoA epoxidase subunit PaaE
MGLFRFRKKDKGSETSDTPKKKSAQGILSKVSNVKKETKDSVILSFEKNGQEDPVAGQYVNITATINGEEVTRSYSLCSSETSEVFSVGVKKVENGKMSTFLTEDVKVGDEFLLSNPMGNFKLTSKTSGKYVAIVAGSGVTPVQSMIESTTDTDVEWDLYYGNRVADNIMFHDRLEAIKNDKLRLNYYLSKDDQPGFHQGRITAARIENILSEKAGFDGLYLCGPEELIQAGIEVAEKLGVDKEKVHYELFTTPVSLGKAEEAPKASFEGIADCTVVIDGEEHEIKLKPGQLMLDAFESADISVPFSCKGGICCSCKAKLTDGSADMMTNMTLSDKEVANGFILTCQAKATSAKVVVDFDE